MLQKHSRKEGAGARWHVDCLDNYHKYLQTMTPQPLKILTAATAMSVALMTSSWAVLLTVPPTQTEQGAILSSTSFQTAGTGVIDPFLRVQANGSETGFNSSGAPQ